MAYRFLKKSKKIMHGCHYLATIKDNYVVFNSEFEYSKEDLIYILKIVNEVVKDEMQNIG